MFERFTDKARQAVVLAQQEARALGHSYIGTEHILLGVLGVPDSIGVRALAELDLTPDEIRGDVIALLTPEEGSPRKHLPFSKQGKQALELSLREALRLGHNYIGTEHILLALVRQEEGLAARALERAGVDHTELRNRIIGLLQAYVVETGTETARARATQVFEGLQGKPGKRELDRVAGPACPGCKGPLSDTIAYRLIEVPQDGGEGRLSMSVVYCEACGHVLQSRQQSEGDAP